MTALAIDNRQYRTNIVWYRLIYPQQMFVVLWTLATIFFFLFCSANPYTGCVICLNIVYSAAVSLSTKIHSVFRSHGKIFL